MRWFLSTSFILLTLILGATPAAHAQRAADAPPSAASLSAPTSAITAPTSIVSNPAAPSLGPSAPTDSVTGTFNPVTGTYGSAADAAAASADAALSATAGLTSGSVISGDPATVKAAADAKAAADKTATQANLDASSGFGGVMAWVMTLFAWLVGVAAITLDNAVYYTVVTMGDYVHKLSAVGVSWRILRDIGNIMLIFGFLAVGITTILNVDWYGGGKKMLPMMIVAAVFLNFSLFITEAIVDAGNLFATQFYTQINGGNPAKPTGYSIGSGTLSLGSGQVSDEPISNAIMGRLGLQTLYNPVANKEIFAAGNTWVIGFMGIILFMTTAFVMFSLAFILIARFVALIFLIIVSPIGFAGLAIPGFKERAEQYWKMLFDQTITAPILLLMLYIALAIITDANFLTGLCVPGNTATFGGPNTNTTCTPSAIGWVSGNFQGFAGFILSFLVAIAALLLVIVYAKRWSAFGGDWASRMGAKLTLGATAFAGRRTVGRVSNFAARSIRSGTFGKRLQASETGRILAGTFDRGAKASFDVRGTGVLKKIPFGSQIDAGEAQKGGYRAREDELIKARTDYAKSLRQSKDQKAATDEENRETVDPKTGKMGTHKEKMKPLEVEEQKLIKESKERVAVEKEALEIERKKLELARKSGDPNLKDKETTYNSKMLEFSNFKEKEKEELEKELEPTRTKITEEKKRHEKFIDSNSVETNQRKYGETLQSGPVMTILRAPYDWPTAVGSARSEAANKIIGESKKSKEQKNIDKLEEILAKSEGKIDSGGGGKKPAEEKPKEKPKE